MKILSNLFLATLILALPLACKSPSSSHSSSTAEIPCTCGTPMGDLEGCANPLCAGGKNNPDNPNCVCGKLDIPTGK